MPGEKLYSEKEIQQILKKAGDLQKDEGDKQASGLTLKEIQQIAKEVGIDPSLVSTAATSLRQTGLDESNFELFGAPTEFEFEYELEGELSEENWPSAIESIRKSFGKLGYSGQVSNTLEWTYSSRKRQLRVVIRPKNGKTKIRFYGNYTRLARMYLIPAPILATVYSFIFLMASTRFFPLAIMMAVMMGVIAVMIARSFYRRRYLKEEKAAKEVYGQLKKMVDPESTALEEREEVSISRERISIDVQDDGQPESVGRSKNRIKS